ncbi:MAG: hypothetical protein JRN15_21840 [Nitrososphaerota archaeon]|nr:hypothetical protein [Nitrososphaerota archaeon]
MKITLESLSKWMRAINALNKTNLVRIALVSVFLTAVDTIQSFYLQRVISVFSEANAMPNLFYGYGPIGYVLYSPIEFLAIFVTLSVLWLWASYVIWFHKNIIMRTL